MGKWLNQIKIKKSVDDGYYLYLFSKMVYELDQIYSEGAFLWLEKNQPGLDQEITRTGRTLNDTWIKAREGLATLEDFRKALDGYKRAIRKGMVGYQINSGGQ